MEDPKQMVDDLAYNAGLEVNYQLQRNFGAANAAGEAVKRLKREILALIESLASAAKGPESTDD